jgi:transcriptional regulator with XRE-family HTH domain
MGRAIQVVRTDRGWSRRDLAERTGLSYSFLSEIENGVKEPSSRTFALIADALDVAPGALLYDAERRLSEIGGASETSAGRDSGATRLGGEPLHPSGRTRSVEELEAEAGYLAAEQSSRDATRVTAPLRESAPRIQRSRRVLDWLAGPLARRSSEDSTPGEAVLPRDGAAVRGYRAALMDLDNSATQLGSPELEGSPESVEQFLGALLPLLGELSLEDRELVLDLARRLSQRESDS